MRTVPYIIFGSELRAFSQKDEFYLCIGMLKSYYDAIEARFSGTMVFMVIVIGSLFTSESTRAALRANSWLGTRRSALFCWSGCTLGGFTIGWTDGQRSTTTQ